MLEILKVHQTHQGAKTITVSHAIFICSCYHYFDLCLTSTYFITSVFHLLSSVFRSLTYPMIFQTLCLSIFCLPSSVCTLIPHCLFPFSVFCPMFLCSVDEPTASSTLWKHHIPSLQNRLPSPDMHIKTTLYKT